MYFLKQIKTLIKEYLWKHNFNLSFKDKKINLTKEKYNYSPHTVYRNFIAPIEINYNYNSSYINYKKKFLDDAFKTYFPIILETQKKYKLNNKKNYFLDLGCGLGPMAVSYLNYITSDKNKSKKYRYLGIDINKKAINWLKNKFENYKEFEFLFHETQLEKDYIQSKSKNINTLIDSNGDEVDYNIPSDIKFDIQWSWSYFTHLTPKACDKVLGIVSKHSDVGGLQFNSWLIIDEESKFALESGLTNRLLPYDMGPYLTRSKENPLTATSYKEDYIYEFYKNNNLKIIEIVKGNWRGLNTGNPNLNQDLIISQKI